MANFLSDTSSNPIVHALTRKIPPKRGLPAFVWIIALAIGVVYYRHKHSTNTGSGAIASTTADTSGLDTTAPFYGTGSGISSDLGGGGGGGDQSGQTQPSSAPVSWDPEQFAGILASDLAPLINPPQDQTPTNDPTSVPNTTQVTTVNGKTTVTTHPSQPLDPKSNPESAFQAGGPGGSHLTQPLKWGGQTFYTQADFNEWVRKHGSSTKAELANHPEAAKIYNQLGKNDLVAATVPSPAAQKAAGRTAPANVTAAPAAAPKSAPAPTVAPKAPPAPVTKNAPVVKRTAVTTPKKPVGGKI